MEPVDELTLSLDRDGDAWTYGLAAESEAGVDLIEALGALLPHVGRLGLPKLPKIRVQQVGVTHGPEGTSVSTRIALSDDFVIDLARLPLVGDEVGERASIRFRTLTLGLTHRSGSDWSTSFGGVIEFAGEPQQLKLTTVADDGTTQPGPHVEPKSRTFGPLTVDSVAVDFDVDRLRVKLNARVGRGRVALDVIGLQATVPLETPADVLFSIDGMAVRYDLPPVTISGGLLIVGEAKPRRYDGSLAVRAGNYGLAAIGSYAETTPPSLLAFLHVAVPIGGPPYLYINSVSAGFGINRELTIPPIEELEHFPLIKGFGDWAPERPGAVDSALEHIGEYLSPRGGGDWLAAGVGIASFGLVKTLAVLTLAFHGRVEIGVLGHATLEFPPAGPKVVSARMALRTVVCPSVGEFSARGQLAPASYIIDPDCRLTGGFAFCVWIHPHDEAGDFVITLGGYHPDFKAPPHYPTVPRLGVAWSPRGVPLRLRGSQYFALTPGLVMTGGLLEANWDKGPLRARFTLGVDFLVGWAPFHYQAELGVSFSLEVNLGKWLKHTVSANVGADVQLWGPPFSGRAHIHFGVMTFAIEFGTKAHQPPKFLEWHEFQEQLLGKPGTLLRLRVRAGLLAEIGRRRYAVDAELFEAASELRVPAAKVTFDGKLEPAKTFAIGPMNLDEGSFESEHELCVERWTTEGWAAYDGFESALLTGTGAPKALWERQETSLGTALEGDGTVDDLLSGVRLTPRAASSPAAPSVAVHPETRDRDAIPWRWDKPAVRDRAEPSDEEGRTALTESIVDADVAARRAEIIKSVLGAGVTVDLDALTHRARLGLRAAPLPAAVTER